MTTANIPDRFYCETSNKQHVDKDIRLTYRHAALF